MSVKYPNFLEVRNSPIHGVGLFTKKPVKRGAVIFTTITEITDYENADFKAVQIWDDECTESVNFMNHSCNPNCFVEIDKSGIKKSGKSARTRVRALRDIKAGEELTYHYATTDFDDRYEHFRCNCHSPICTGFFDGFRYLSEERQKELLPYASDYVKKRFREENVFVSLVRRILHSAARFIGNFYQ